MAHLFSVLDFQLTLMQLGLCLLENVVEKANHTADAKAVVVDKMEDNFFWSCVLAISSTFSLNRLVLCRLGNNLCSAGICFLTSSKAKADMTSSMY